MNHKNGCDDIVNKLKSSDVSVLAMMYMGKQHTQSQRMVYGNTCVRPRYHTWNRYTFVSMTWSLGVYQSADGYGYYQRQHYKPQWCLYQDSCIVICLSNATFYDGFSWIKKFKNNPQNLDHYYWQGSGQSQKDHEDRPMRVYCRGTLSYHTIDD